MGAIEETYEEEIDADISLEEYRTAVQDRIEQMGGLADEETAAMLVAHELEEDGGEVGNIAEIKPKMDEVKFVGKVISVGELRAFERDEETDEEDDEAKGHVVNLELADESGQIRVALWDGLAVDASETLEEGQVLRVKGRPKEGYSGVEVNAEKAEPDTETEINVSVADTYQISDLSLGLSDVNLKGKVLDTEPVRTFDRDDESEGKVANLVLGDETGRIRVTLWDEKAPQTEELAEGQSVEVIDGYVRERDGSLELHAGNRGAIEKLDEEIEYEPTGTPIGEVEMGDTVDLVGVIRSSDPKRTFDRDDGSEGQVRNIRIQDDTDDIRVALWGDLADKEIGPGERIAVTDVEIEDGWQDDLEGSANWQSSITVLDTDPAPQQESTADSGVNLSSFEDTEQSTDVGKTESSTEAESTERQQSGSGDSIEFTGTVVQSRNPIILDNGEETISIETDKQVNLGEEITVRGEKRENGRIIAAEII